MDITDLLAGSIGSNQDYYAQDPFYNAGRSIFSTQVRPTNDWEALLGPIAQGLAGGTLMGYGKRQAGQAAFEDAQQSSLIAPLLKQAQFIGPRPEGEEVAALPESLAMYLQEEAPEGFTPNKARQSILTGLLQQQQAQEAAAKNRERLTKLSDELIKADKEPIIEGGKVVGVRTLPGAADVVSELEKAKEGPDTSEAWWKDVPATDKTKLVQARGVISELDKLAKEFEDLNMNAVEFNAKKDVSGNKANELKSKMITLIPNAVRLMGEVGNLGEQEQQRVIAATLGNLTSGSQGAAQRIKNLSDQSHGIVSSKLEGYKLAQTDPGSLLERDVPAPPKPHPSQFKSLGEFKAAKEAWRQAGGG